jgi:hypothetical protein
MAYALSCGMLHLKDHAVARGCGILTGMHHKLKRVNAVEADLYISSEFMHPQGAAAIEADTQTSSHCPLVI